MDQSIQKGIRKGVDSGELVIYKAPIVESLLNFTITYPTNIPSFRITLWSLRNAETCLLNITGICGTRQVMCTFISYKYLWKCFVSWLFNWRVTFNFHSGSNEEGGRNKTETTGKIYHEQVSKSFFINNRACLELIFYCYHFMLNNSI